MEKNIHIYVYIHIWTVAHQAPLSMEFSRQEKENCHSLLQGIFPTQVWNPGLPHCRQILYHLSHQGSPSIQFSRSVVSNSLQPHGLQHARIPCPSPAPRACSNSCLLSWWCHPTMSSSVIPFCSCLQSFPASGSFPMSQFFPSGGQSIGVSASALVLPMNIQDWFPLGNHTVIPSYLSLYLSWTLRGWNNFYLQ